MSSLIYESKPAREQPICTLIQSNNEPGNMIALLKLILEREPGIMEWPGWLTPGSENPRAK
jgi:hypothetical protein